MDKSEEAKVVVGGGTGIAAMHHIIKGHHMAGNRVVGSIGARTRDLLLFEEELGRVCREGLVSTNEAPGPPGPGDGHPDRRAGGIRQGRSRSPGWLHLR